MKPPATRPLVVIFMGVSGCGKTTVGTLFAKKTGAIFFEGDEFHPPENVEKMRRGIPLTDQDRTEWLRTLRQIITRSLNRGTLTVMACSALKATYRDQLRDGDARVQFVHLTCPRALLEKRLKARKNHFMPPTLLDSQLTTLEPPADALTFSCQKSPEEIVSALVPALGWA